MSDPKNKATPQPTPSGKSEKLENAQAKADGNTEMVDLDAFLLELSERLVTAGSIPLPQAQPAPVEPVEEIQAIVFRLGDTRYAVEMGYVGEVLRGPDITHLPGSLPAWLLGVTNLHGEIMSVVDLSAFLAVDPTANDQQANSMLVAQAADQRIGLMVDDVELIYTFPLEHVLSPPFKVDPGIVTYLRGAVEREKAFIRLLDCERLLLGPEMQQFS